MAARSYGGLVLLWDRQAGGAPATFRGRNCRATTNALAFSPNSQLLALVRRDTRVAELWNYGQLPEDVLGSNPDGALRPMDSKPLEHPRHDECKPDDSGPSVNLFVQNLQVGGKKVSKKVRTHIGSIQNAVIGAIGNARDVHVFSENVGNSTRLDAEVKQKLREAREAIETLEMTQAQKDDIADDLGKLAEELQKPEPTTSRIQDLLKRIEVVASGVAAILKPVAAIAKYLV